MSATRRLKDPRRENGIVRCAWCGTDEIEDWTLRDKTGYFYCSWGCYRADPQGYTNVKRNSILFGLSIALVSTIISALIAQLSAFEVLLVSVIFLSICPGCAYLGCIDGAVRAEEYRKSVPRGSRYREHVGREKSIEILDALTCPICGADLDPPKLGPNEIYHCEFCGANVKLPEWTK